MIFHDSAASDTLWSLYKPYTYGLPVSDCSYESSSSDNNASSVASNARA